MRDMLERALAILERARQRPRPPERGHDADEPRERVRLGDHAKKRDMLERALAIKERAYGRDHPSVAITLTNLGPRTAPASATTPRKRDVLERALAINERA